MLRDLDKLHKNWKTLPEFKEFVDLVGTLQPDQVEETTGMVRVAGKETMLRQTEIFFTEYRATFMGISGFKRWMTSLALFCLGSSNS